MRGRVWWRRGFRAFVVEARVNERIKRRRRMYLYYVKRASATGNMVHGVVSVIFRSNALESPSFKERHRECRYVRDGLYASLRVKISPSLGSTVSSAGRRLVIKKFERVAARATRCVRERKNIALAGA